MVGTVTTKFATATVISNWEHCHHCGGPLEGGPVTIEGREALQDVTCLQCEAVWVEVYVADRRIETEWYDPEEDDGVDPSNGGHAWNGIGEPDAV